jgi:hypothetical protein
MGEISDLIVRGVICDRCGATLDGAAPGHPRTCANCGGGPGPLVKRERCPKCGRAVRATGLQDHLRDAHG